MSAANDSKERLLGDYQWALRRLLANMLRVSRGAGKAHEIVDDAAKVVLASEAYREAAGFYPSEYETTTCLSLPDCPPGVKGDEVEFFYAERTMVSGAMQIVASELLGQRTQVSAGSSQLHDGWRMKLDYVRRKRRSI